MAGVRSLQPVCRDCINIREGKAGDVQADLHSAIAHTVTDGHRPVLNSRALLRGMWDLRASRVAQQ